MSGQQDHFILGIETRESAHQKDAMNIKLGIKNRATTY